MTELFALSYALLWGLVVLQAVVLRHAVRRTVWFKRLCADLSRRSESEKHESLSTGSPAPDFTARMLWTGEWFCTSHLEGYTSTLLFVTPEQISPLYESLSFAIHGMWHQTKGHVYLVCNGSEEACRQLAREHCVEGFTGDQVPVILDEGGQIARIFLVNSTPQAVSLDKNLRVWRYGHQVLSNPEVEIQVEKSSIQVEDALPGAKKVCPDSATERGDEETTVAETMHSANGTNEKRCFWPDDRPYTGATYARMDTTVSCVLTRFRLRSILSLIPFYLAFRRVRRSAQDVAGLLKSVFLVEDLHTCYTMSLWRDDCAIVEFGGLHAHVAAANSAFHPTYRKDLNRAEIWSAQFRLWAVSCHNMNWEGLDLQELLADQWGRREVMARAGLFEEQNTDGRQLEIPAGG